jgi:hypothetical protein
MGVVPAAKAVDVIEGSGKRLNESNEAISAKTIARF